MPKFETFLPVFTGFYGTLFEPDYSRVLDNYDVTSDDVTFNKESYFEAAGKMCCAFLQEELKLFLAEIRFQKVQSPRFYNYSNDEIHCEILLLKGHLVAIQQYMKENKDAWQLYLDGRYVSHPGFFSKHSHKAADWKKITSNYKDFDQDPHHLGAILEFICDNEEIDEQSMADHISDKLDIEEHMLVPHHGALLLNKVFGTEEFDIEKINFHAIDNGCHLKNEIQEIADCILQRDLEYLDFDPLQRAQEIFELVKNLFITPKESENNLKLHLE